MSVLPSSGERHIQEDKSSEFNPLSRALQENEEWYRDLVEHSRDLLCIHDLQGRLLRVNPAAARLLGYSMEELLLISMRDLVVPEFRPQFDQYLERVARDGEGHGLLALRTRSGEQRIWEYHNTLRTEGVTTPVVRGMAHDVTEQIRAQKALRESEERYRSVIAAMAEGVLLQQADGKIIACNGSAERILGLTSGELMGQTSLDWESSTIHDDGSPFRAETYPATVTLRTGAPQTNVCMGVRRPDGGLRWLEINSEPLSRHNESLPDAVVISFTDVTERRQAEEALRQSEARLRLAQEVARIGTFERNFVNGTSRWSPEMEAMYGLPPGGFPKSVEAFFELVHPEDRAGVEQLLAQSMDSGSGEGEWRVIWPDGTVRWISGRWRVFQDEQGRSLRSIGMGFDVTERRRAEEELRRGEERYRSLALASNQVVWTVPAGEDAVDLPTWCEFTGQSPESTRGWGWLESVHPEDRGATAAAWSNAAKNRSVYEREHRVRRRDGEYFYFAVRGVPVLEKDGSIREWIGTCSDITERKKAEEALRNSEERFRALYEKAPVGIALVDSGQGQFVQVNPRFCEIVGRSADELQRLDVRSITHPDDFGKGSAHLPSLLEGKQGQFEIEKRYLRPDGSVRWVRVFVVPMYGKQEETRHLHMALVDDFTERRQAEEALRQSDERFRVALKNSPITVFNQDRDLRYTWVYNPTLPRPASDMVGKDLREFWGREEGDAMAEVRRRVLETGVGARQEVQVTSEGGKHYFDTTIEPVVDAAGAVIGLTGASTDVTHLHKITEELRQAKERLAEEKLYLEQEINTELGFEEIIGQSAALKEVMEQVAKVASSDATVLLQGETGTGKELVARALHRLSRRASGSFIKTNCAAIPSGLLESELFGHEKGAFTSAISRKIGRLELADKGTLFLDEIGEIPVVLQPKLLRVLQDQEFERLGGTQTLKVNFRLIAATNRDLAESMRENEFRSDLYYRLNVFPIRVPPLRERREDIRLLMEHFVRKCAKRMNRTITSIPKKTMEAMMQWDWPGNVRELENFVERSVILTRGSVLQAPLSELAGPTPKPETETLKDIEREHILRALQESHGKLAGPGGAADRLGLKRTTLQSKLKQLGIRRGTPHATTN